MSWPGTRHRALGIRPRGGVLYLSRPGSQSTTTTKKKRPTRQTTGEAPSLGAPLLSAAASAAYTRKHHRPIPEPTRAAWTAMQPRRRLLLGEGGPRRGSTPGAAAATAARPNRDAQEVGCALWALTDACWALEITGLWQRLHRALGDTRCQGTLLAAAPAGRVSSWGVQATPRVVRPAVPAQDALGNREGESGRHGRGRRREPVGAARGVSGGQIRTPRRPRQQHRHRRPAPTPRLLCASDICACTAM